MSCLRLKKQLQHFFFNWPYNYIIKCHLIKMNDSLSVQPFHDSLLCLAVKLWRTVPVVVGFKRTVLIKAQVFCLLISKLCQVGLKGGQVQTGDVLIWNVPIGWHTHMQKTEHGTRGCVCWGEARCEVAATHSANITTTLTTKGSQGGVIVHPHPSFWEASTHPACISPLERCTTQ